MDLVKVSEVVQRALKFFRNGAHTSQLWDLTVQESDLD